jgi:hypothetical protein
VRAEDVTPERVTVFVACLVTLLFVVGVVFFARALSDPGPQQEDSCEAARISANAVTQREDTTEDEVEYLSRTETADRICAGLD